MSKFQFAKATKKQSRGRVALIGPSGSGKTYTALAIATALGKRVAVIDTERGSASKYARSERHPELFDFDVLELESFEPGNYVEAIHAAEAARFDVVIVDSLSHAWMGKGGALEQVEMERKKKGDRGNSFTAWREVTPQHNALVDAMLQCRSHLIVTMRTKTEYVLEEDDRGKKVPKKVGLAPIQRDGLDYEFDVTAELTLGNDMVIDKTRCPELKGKVFHKAGQDVADVLRYWLDDGVPAPERPAVRIIAALEMAGTDQDLASVRNEVAQLRAANRFSASEFDAIQQAGLAAKARIAGTVAA